MNRLTEALNLKMAVGNTGAHGMQRPTDLGATAEGFDQMESSARIEHDEVDGSLELNVAEDLVQSRSAR